MAYLNVIEIESALQNLAAAYPDITEQIVLPNLTHERRRTSALRIGKKSASAVSGVLILGGVHAREWVPPDALVSLAADLLEAYATGTGLVYGGKRFTAENIRQIVEDLNLFIYPCVNPDGRFHSQTNDPLWRKNRRPHSSSGNCIGVDLNRNFDFLWDHLTKFAPDSGVSASADPCDKFVYRGPSPSSEPETKNVVWLLDTFPRIQWHVDVHSAVPVILHSWGSDQNQTTEPTQNFLNSTFDRVRGRANDGVYGEYIAQADLDIFKMLGQHMDEAVKAVRGNGYSVEQAFGLYPTSGASDDYAFSRHFANPSKTKVYGFTVECGSSFQPQWTEAEAVIREVSSGLIAFSLAALNSTVASLKCAMWTHGHSLKIEYPDRMQSVWRAGFYTRIQGKPNTSNWFHFAIPTPVIVNGDRLSVGSVMIRFRSSSDKAVVHAVHVYDGETKIASHDGLRLSPQGNFDWLRFDVPGHPTIKWGLGISIGVRFEGSSATQNQMEFSSAGCDFLN